MRASGWYWLAAAVVLLAGCDKKPRLEGGVDLHAAAWDGDLSRVQTLLARGVPVDARTATGRTALHDAAQRGHQEVAEVLIRCGASLNRLDEDGRTPATLAMEAGHRAMVQYLVEAGATVDLRLTAYLGDAGRTRRLIEGGADLNAPGKDRWSPLHYAAAGNHKEIADLLIAGGAKVDARDRRRETPLHVAAKEDCADIVGLLLARGAEPNAQNSDGDTPLHWAAYYDHMNVVRLLLSSGADLEARNKEGETPLYLAAGFGHTGPAELLLAAGASADGAKSVKGSSGVLLTEAIESGYIDAVRLLVPRVKDLNASLPLHAAIRGRLGGACTRFEHEHPDAKATFEERQALVEDAMERLRIRMVELLLAQGADANRKDADEMSPLHCAAAEGLRDVAELLVSKGANVKTGATHRYRAPDGRDILFGGVTPLHEAAWAGDPNVADLLLRHGAEVDARTESGQTALHYAAGYGNIHEWSFPPRQRWHPGRAWQYDTVVDLLVDKGAAVNAEDNSGATPLLYALQTGQTGIAKALIAAGAKRVTVKNQANQTMLHDALRRTDPTLFRLLLANGADVEEKDADGNTVLHLVARDPNEELARLLIARHANVNARNRGGLTPLHYAASHPDGNFVSLLLVNGADKDARDNNGDVPLHSAARRGLKEVVEVLVAHGADVSVKNSRGRTPREEAERRGHKDVAALLSTKATTSSKP